MKEFVDKLIERLEEHCGIAKEICCCDGCCSECDFRASIEIVKELEEEYQPRVMIDKQYCWQTCVCTDKCMECNRLTEGDFDYYESIADWDDEYSNKSTNTSIWIPCSERLPNKEEYLKDDGRFIVTDGNRRYQSIYDIYEGRFRTVKLFNNGGSVRGWDFEADNCVIAWQPLPAPYRKGE